MWYDTLVFPLLFIKVNLVWYKARHLVRVKLTITPLKLLSITPHKLSSIFFVYEVNE